MQVGIMIVSVEKLAKGAIEYYGRFRRLKQAFVDLGSWVRGALHRTGNS